MTHFEGDSMTTSIFDEWEASKHQELASLYPQNIVQILQSLSLWNGKPFL